MAQTTSEAQRAWREKNNLMRMETAVPADLCEWLETSAVDTGMSRTQLVVTLLLRARAEAQAPVKTGAK